MDEETERVLHGAKLFATHGLDHLEHLVSEMNSRNSPFFPPEEIRLIALARTHVETGLMYLDKFERKIRNGKSN